MNNNDKFHFFIGNIFTDDNQIYLLRKIQKKLRQKYSIKKFHYNNRFFTNLLYLGYFNIETANLYMEKIISPLLQALSEKIHVLDCSYTGFKIDYDKKYYKVSLKFNDIDNYLEQIIVPYLYTNGIEPIYEKKKNILKPYVDLIYFDESPKLNDKIDISIELPKDRFKIDHISLIKGTPNKYRVGTPSLHDQMSLEEITRYIIPLNNNN
jgi:hypothetical protein